jgi:hypothetical protein
LDIPLEDLKKKKFKLIEHTNRQTNFQKYTVDMESESQNLKSTVTVASPLPNFKQKIYNQDTVDVSKRNKRS